MAQKNEMDCKILNDNTDDPDMMNKFIFSNEGELQSNGMNLGGTTGCTKSTEFPAFRFIQT